MREKRKTQTKNYHCSILNTAFLVQESTLVLLVYDYDKFSRHKLMGEVRVDLSRVETSNSVEMWCDVQKQQQVL